VSGQRILVVKLGALGDFVQSLGPFAAIRHHHPKAQITLLTTAPFRRFAEASRWFDQVWTDDRPGFAQIGGWLELRRRLRGGRFDRVYDLQTSDRSSAYYRLFWPGPRPEWSGIAAGCSHPHANPNRDTLHTIDRQAEQLRIAGIPSAPAADLGWVAADASRFAVGDAAVVLVPGGARHRPDKRWPADRFAALARRLVDKGCHPVLLGGEAEAEILAAVAAAVPEAQNLCGRTDLFDLVALARAARAAVGNDTGPMHLIAAAGCPSLVLFSAASDPALCAPRGDRVAIRQASDLTHLTVEDVLEALSGWLGRC